MFSAAQKYFFQLKAPGSATISTHSGRVQTDIARPLTTLAFHVEKLHQPRTWARLKETAARLADQNIHATFFIYPFPAVLAGNDLACQVRLLASLGHEIAQHTHFYSGAQIGKEEKVDDLSEANIVSCMRRDFMALCQTGYRPRGFTAGSWFVNDQVLDTLIELGFVYDCSAQFQNVRTTPNRSLHRWLSAPRTYRNGRGQLLCLPTTCSLGEWFKWGRKSTHSNALTYQIVYLHDYDLLSISRIVLLAGFLKTVRANRLETSSALAAHYPVLRGDL